MWILLAILVFLLNGILAQTDLREHTVGATRVFPKTSFTCQGRAAGYYADVETGCQVYHMCDGLGRQFNYACPNTTLFQQRMLICDHWYMVNCSRAESNYAANLLIGQRDKPFVPEEENEIRTPRPDLIDRPYAPDYAGESYRRQYNKNVASSLNAIETISTGGNKFAYRKPSNSEIFQESATNHGLPALLNNEDAENDELTTPDLPNDLIEENSSKFNGRRNVRKDGVPVNVDIAQINRQAEIRAPVASPSSTGQKAKEPADFIELPFLEPNYNAAFNAEKKSAAIIAATTTTRAPNTNVNHNNFKPFEGILNSGKKATHNDYDFSKYIRTSSNSGQVAQRRQDTVTTTTRTTTTQRPTAPTTTTTRRASTTTTTRRVTTTATAQPQRRVDFVQPVISKNTQQQAFVQARQFPELILSLEPLLPPPQPNANIKNNSKRDNLDTAVPTSPFTAPAVSPPQKLANDIAVPSPRLVPPKDKFATYDDSTTQGPPIYYEWKIPASGLLPPKEDNETNSNDVNNNVFDSSISSENDSKDHSQATRSISNESVNSKLESEILINKLEKTFVKDENNYKDLQKKFLIPEFLFPLESSVQRSGYDHIGSGAVNSFQIQIPARLEKDKPWYGENLNCPECHPSFLKPGTCEPCIKIRR